MMLLLSVKNPSRIKFKKSLYQTEFDDDTSEPRKEWGKYWKTFHAPLLGRKTKAEDIQAIKRALGGYDGFKENHDLNLLSLIFGQPSDSFERKKATQSLRDMTFDKFISPETSAASDIKNKMAARGIYRVFWDELLRMTLTGSRIAPTDEQEIKEYQKKLKDGKIDQQALDTIAQDPLALGEAYARARQFLASQPSSSDSGVIPHHLFSHDSPEGGPFMAEDVAPSYTLGNQDYWRGVADIARGVHGTTVFPTILDPNSAKRIGSSISGIETYTPSQWFDKYKTLSPEMRQRIGIPMPQGWDPKKSDDEQVAPEDLINPDAKGISFFDKIKRTIQYGPKPNKSTVGPSVDDWAAQAGKPVSFQLFPTKGAFDKFNWHMMEYINHQAINLKAAGLSDEQIRKNLQTMAEDERASYIDTHRGSEVAIPLGSNMGGQKAPTWSSKDHQDWGKASKMAVDAVKGNSHILAFPEAPLEIKKPDES